MPMTDTSDGQIKRLVMELMDSAPQAPTISELDWQDDLRAVAPKSTGRVATFRSRSTALVGGLAAVVIVALLLVVLLPPIGQNVMAFISR
jgi:hypothetical protein